MTHQEIEEVRRVFSYTGEEQRLFGWPRKYMSLLADRLDRVLQDPGARHRFMLAGLFLTYRAANFAGESLSTERGPETDRGYTDKRLEAFKRLDGTPIDSTRAYLRLIGFRPWRWKLFGIDRSLYRFVVSGMGKKKGVLG